MRWHFSQPHRLAASAISSCDGEGAGVPSSGEEATRSGVSSLEEVAREYVRASSTEAGERVGSVCRMRCVSARMMGIRSHAVGCAFLSWT